MKFQCVCALSLLVWLSLASSCSCTGYGGYRHSDLGSYKNGYTIWYDFFQYNLMYDHESLMAVNC